MSRNKSPLCGTLPFFATVAVMAITASGADSLLLHRWSFNNDFTDSAGGQTATATNYSFVAYGSGYAVKTQGGTIGTSYVSLGTDILPKDGRSFTFELWVRLDAWENEQYRMFTIGNDTNNNKFDQTWGYKGTAGEDYTLVTGTKNNYVRNDRGLAPFCVNKFYHLAYVFTPLSDGRWSVRAYKHDSSSGNLQAKTAFAVHEGWKPSSLTQTHCVLASSFYSHHNDSKASFDEVRVWGRALSENEIAASVLAGPDATIPDGDSPFGKTVFDTAKNTRELPAGQTFADIAEKLSAGFLRLSGDNSALSSLAVFDGVLALTGGSLAATEKRVTIGDGLCGIAALAATDGATLNLRGVTGNGCGEVVLDGSTLRIQGAAATPTLVHRWSFNGNLNDSVGGQTATWKNASFSDCGNGQAVTLSGGASTNSYVDLGVNVLPTGNAGATIELWARNDAYVGSARMFDFGNAINHSAMLCWTANGLNTDYAIIRYAPQKQVLTQHELAPYTYGKMFHIAATYSPNGDGTWTMRAYKQDVATGATLKVTTFKAQSGWSLANLVQTHCYLGQGFDSAGSAKATYDEVRIWNGVLTEAQLSANAVAGPDAIDGGEIKANTSSIAGLVSMRVGASGATIDTNGKDVSMHTPVSSLAEGLVHRWSFHDDLSDSVGGETATASGYDFVDMGTGRGIKLTGGAKNVSCVDLGAWVVPTNGVGATIELWARNDTITDSERMFDIGDSSTNSIMMCWTSSANVNTDLLLVRNGRGSNGKIIQALTQSELAPYVVGTEYHIAATCSLNSDGSWTVRGYKQNLSTGITEKKSVLIPPSGWTLSRVIQEHAYLGRSFDSAFDSAASYNEVRIYNRALSEAELMASAAAGPDADLSACALVKTGLGTLTLCGTNSLACPLRVATGAVRTAIGAALSTNSVVELYGGTLLDLGGCSAVAGGLTGGGAVVSNGTLSVTGAICPTGEIVLDETDVSGTLEVTSGSGLLRRVNGVMDLSGIDLDVKSVSPNGQTIIECADGFMGDFASVSLPTNRRLLRSATKVRVVRAGLVVIIR